MNDDHGIEAALASETATVTDTAPATDLRQEAPVLIVDDDKMYTLALRRFLQGRGVRVTVCNTAQQALTLPPGTYRAAVVDVYLEGDKDGLRLVRRLLTLQPDLPVIVISGCSDDDVRTAVQQSGAAHFITKPFRLGHLLTVLGHLLQVQASVGAAADGTQEPALFVAAEAA